MDLERQIAIKNEYLGFILALAYDYDGFNTVEGLKGLIDELNGNDFNILHEKIGE